MKKSWISFKGKGEQCILGSDPCARQRALHRAGGNPARKENNHLIR